MRTRLLISASAALILVAATACRSRGPAPSSKPAKPVAVNPRSMEVARPATPPPTTAQTTAPTTTAPPTAVAHPVAAPIAPQGPRPPRGTLLSLMFSGNGQGEIEPCG